jgi:hypothetical protein
LPQIKLKIWQQNANNNMMGSTGSKPVQIISIFMIVRLDIPANQNVRSQSDGIHSKDPNSLQTRMDL